MMISCQLYSGAFVIFLGLVIAGLFSQPVSAFSEEELQKPNTTMRLNLAGNVGGNSNIFGSGNWDLYVGADQRSRAQFEIDNSYSSNLIIESKPVEIGRFRIRF